MGEKSVKITIIHPTKKRQVKKIHRRNPGIRFLRFFYSPSCLLSNGNPSNKQGLGKIEDKVKIINDFMREKEEPA